MSYLDTVNEKKNLHAQTSKEQHDQAAMFRELQKMQMAALMGQSKPSVVLTDQTDLGDKIKELTSKLVEAVKSADTTKLNSEQIANLKDLRSALESLSAAVKSNKPDNTAIINAIKSLKLEVAAPIINVEPTAVTVSNDFTPLQDTIKEYFKAPDDEKIDLDCYRAQDITDNGDTQYVGFVNPEGNWYIIENKVRENQLRYIFGDKGYAKAFKKAAQYEYMLLNEAINAVRP